MTKDEFYASYLKKNSTPLKKVDLLAIIRMKRRTSMKMIIPVSTQHYDSHLENNDGNQDDNIDIKRG